MKVAVIMGSDSDLPIMQEACKVLEELGVEYEVDIVSAHRTPEKMYKFAKESYDRGIKVIIAGAGGAAHLPGMVAALTSVPVIGVPIMSKTMSGIDSLYSIVQMPAGIPVATMAINGSQNAGILAGEIVAMSSVLVYKKLVEYKIGLQNKVDKASKELAEKGFENYLS